MNAKAALLRRRLACLGEDSRFRIVLALSARELCVTALGAEVGLSQSCTTRHLQALEREGIVRGHREGRRVLYALHADDPAVADLVAWVTGTGPAAAASARDADHAEGPGTYAASPPAIPAARRSLARRAAKGDAAAPAEARPGTPRSQPPAEPTADPAPVPRVPSGDMEDWLL